MFSARRVCFVLNNVLRILPPLLPQYSITHWSIDYCNTIVPLPKTCLARLEERVSYSVPELCFILKDLLLRVRPLLSLRLSRLLNQLLARK